MTAGAVEAAVVEAAEVMMPAAVEAVEAAAAVKTMATTGAVLQQLRLAVTVTIVHQRERKSVLVVIAMNGEVAELTRTKLLHLVAQPLLGMRRLTRVAGAGRPRHQLLLPRKRHLDLGDGLPCARLSARSLPKRRPRTALQRAVAMLG